MAAVLVGALVLLFVLIFGYIVQYLLKVPGRSPSFPILMVGALASLLAAVFMIVGMPAVTFRPVETPRTNTYEGLAVRGRQVYLREGCWYCHTQFVRPQDRDLGPVSRPEDFALDKPHLLGTERTGPDLSNIGARGFPDQWFLARLYNPRSVFPGSLMPPFPFLFEGSPDQPGEDALALVAYLQSLGRNRQQEVEQRKLSMPIAYQQVENPVGVSWGSIGTGAGIYQEKCLFCHGPKGEGDGPVGKTLTKQPANFTNPRFKFRSEQYFFWRISTGVPGTRMPEWGRSLNEEQRWNLVNYVRFLAGLITPETLGGVPLPEEEREIREAQQLPAGELILPESVEPAEIGVPGASEVEGQ